MKRFLLLSLLLLGFQAAQAQQILEISISPANPDDNDEIMVIIRSQFSSGGCDGDLSHYVVGDTVFSTGMHCPGMLTVICESIDTLILPPLAAGTYTINHTLMQGTGNPCDAFSTVDEDNLGFTVVPSTAGLVDKHLDKFKIFPNPADDFFHLASKDPSEHVAVEIYSLSGKLVLKEDVILKDGVSVSKLESGFYVVVLTNSMGEIGRLKLEKN